MKYLITLQVFSLCIVKAIGTCPSLKSFPNLDRRSPTTELGEGKPVEDIYLPAGWYGEPGIEIPHKNVAYKHCGTVYPIFLKEKPFIEVPGQIETIGLCLLNSDGVCVARNYTIQTQYCSVELRAYNLIQIRQPYSSYCAGPAGTDYPKYTTDVNLTVELNQTKYEFKCDFKPSNESTLYYKIYWYVNDKLSFSTPRFDDVSNETNFIYKESDLPVSKIGFTIRCSFRASFEDDSELGVYSGSETKFVGIEILTKSLAMEVNQQNVYIELKLTVPFNCPKFGPCELPVEVINTDKNNCGATTTLAMSRNCGVKVNGENLNTIYQIAIKAEEAVTYTKAGIQTRLVTLRTVDSFLDHEIWQGADIGEVKVLISNLDSSILAGKQCSAYNDPHMRLFAGIPYEHQYEGTFILYRNKDLLQEVQMKTTPCSSIARCICGVAVRSGRRVFRMNACDEPRGDIRDVLCDDPPELLNVMKMNDVNYKMTFISKTEVTVSGRTWFNVYIKPSTADVARGALKGSDGLCGAIEGPKVFVRKGGGSEEKYSTQFSESWRVGVGDVDLFDDAQLDNLKAHPGDVLHCNCFAPSTSTIVNSVDCVKNNCRKVGKPTPINTECRGRSKRSVRNKRSFHNLSKRQVNDSETGWRNGWTEEKAREYCEDMFRKSQAIQRCVADVPYVETEGNLKNCILDIEFMGDTSFAIVAVDSVKQLCIKEIESNLTLQQAEPGKKSVFEMIQEVACPSECSNHGICEDGKCICEADFKGADCSFDVTEPPEVSSTENDGFCDVQNDNCTKISVYGGFFVAWEKAMCKMELSKMNEQSALKYQSRSLSPLYAESISEAVCTLPKTRNRRSVEVEPEEGAVNVYSISITNNGESFSTETTVVIFNSKCHACTMENSDVKCEFKKNFCISGADCYDDGEPLKNNDCFTCSLNGTEPKWQRSEDKRCVMKETTDNTGNTDSTGNTGSTGSTGNTGSTGSTGNTGSGVYGRLQWMMVGMVVWLVFTAV